MRTIKKILMDNYNHRYQILQMAYYTQKKTYRGSDLGFIWCYLKPSLYVAVFYLAITIGFKSSKGISNIECPYFVWLMIGLVSWFYMRDMLVGGAAVYKRNVLIIKKTTFPSTIIPTLVACSYMMIHLGLLAMALILSIMMGVRPTIYWLQLPIYTCMMFVFSIIWGTAAGLLSVVSRDFFNFLKSISTAIFWLSAIMFDVNRSGGKIQYFFLFNPVTYIAEGYRNCICRSIWIFEEPRKLLCYLIVTSLLIIFAVIMEKKVRKDLPDLI